MTTIAVNSLMVRLREVLEDGYGSLRTVAADTYGGNLPDALTSMGDSVRSLGQPQVECLITGIERSPSSPMLLGNAALYKVDVRVRVVRRLSADLSVAEAARDAVKAAAATDADVIAQVLSKPGNLTATEAAAATGLVSGMLSYRSSSLTVTSVVEDGSSVIESNHLFQGTIQSAPPVS